MPNTATKPQTTVLLVGKDNTMRAVLADALQKAGLKVREAATGGEALASVAQKPDLILLDLDLPDLSGFEVCRRLKLDAAVAAVPVLLMSPTFTEEAERLQALAAGADDYLIAPAEPAELFDHIKALLSVSPDSEESEDAG
jgi:DNA-binding response OmpR family regulator